ncbi:zinc finger protein 184-like [Latimeria chalumnae]|uniref:zinc finger protein 184-like n=1 Tax=Latimeria chalumnae TaxID=7897 RepID=UPI00313B6AF2
MNSSTDVPLIKTEPVWERDIVNLPEETRNMTVNPNQVKTERTFAEIEMYFTREEWRELQDWEKEVYRDIKEHYDIVISYRYTFPKPDFVCEREETSQIPAWKSPLSRENGSPVLTENRMVRDSSESPVNSCSKVVTINKTVTMEQAEQMKKRVTIQQFVLPPFKGRSITQTNGNHTLYKCTECRNKFTSLEKLQKHCKVHHRTTSKHVGNKRNHSQLCNLKPLKEHRGYARQKLQSPLQHGPLQLHAGEKLYTCAEGGKSFTRSLYPGFHQQTQTGKKPYKCKDDEKSFSHASDLIKHQKSHAREKLYKCTECRKSFFSSMSLKKHQQVHTGEKPCKRTQCGKESMALSNLNRPEQIHTVEKLNKGTEYGERFQQIRDRNCHQTHTGEKPYKRTQHGKKSMELSNLLHKHQIHTGKKLYECEKCGKSYSTLLDLNKHQKIHTGKKQNKGVECGMNFRDSSKLNRHQLIHPGKKLYEC